MALTPKRSRRILLLSVILILISSVFVAFKQGLIKIDPILLSVLELFITFFLSLLIATVVVRLTANKVWNMFEKEMELEQRIIISKLYSISLYTIAIIVTFWKAGVSLGNITIFVGLIATGFAFAIRDLLLSFFAWFIILNKKPFHMGDYIIIGDDTGLVTRIGTFFFTLEQHYSGEYIKVPNSLILTKAILNRGSGKFREKLRIGLASIPDDVQERLLELASFIRSRSHLKDNVKAQLVADENGWFISISYYTSFKHENLNGAIYTETWRLFGEHLRMNSWNISAGTASS